MDKKPIISIFLLLFLCISGCVSGDRGGVSVSTPSDIPTDTEIIEGMKTGKTPAGGKTVDQHDEDILELKHWKYGSERAQPSEQQPSGELVSPQQPQLSVRDDDIGEWETVAIPILSEEEFEQIIKRLIDLGYLEKPVTSESKIQGAIRNFQNDNSLPVTGNLDGATRELIRGK